MRHTYCNVMHAQHQMFHLEWKADTFIPDLTLILIFCQRMNFQGSLQSNPTYYPCQSSIGISWDSLYLNQLPQRAGSHRADAIGISASLQLSPCAVKSCNVFQGDCIPGSRITQTCIMNKPFISYCVTGTVISRSPKLPAKEYHIQK